MENYSAYADKTSVENGLLLLAEICNALDRGTKHFHPRSGQLLPTAKDILQCLLDEGTVEFKPAAIT